MITDKEVRETRLTEDGVAVDASIHRLCTVKLGTALLTSGQIRKYLEVRRKATGLALNLIFSVITKARYSGEDKLYKHLTDLMRKEDEVATNKYSSLAQALTIEQAIEVMELLQKDFSDLAPVQWWQENGLVTELFHKYVSNKHWFQGV